MDNDDIFWERLKEMPDVEAVEELKLRRARVVIENRRLVQLTMGRTDPAVYPLRIELLNVQALLGMLGDEIKRRHHRMDGANWRAAVRALWGEEGYALAREWMIRNGS